MDLGLAGKKALVTGSSRGLGYATAMLLAKDGAQLAINSRDPQAISAAAETMRANTGQAVFAIPGDLSLPEVPAEVVQRAAQALGGLDILVTNAGGPPAGKFESFDDLAWQKALDLTLMNHVRLIRAALPYLRNSKTASILAITSISAKQPISNLVFSNSIRAGVLGLVKSLALELGSDGIRVNAILPAWTETERVYDLLANRAKLNDSTVEEEASRLAKESPFGRLGRPEEFAQAAAFLVSPAASFLTGVMLNVDGGFYKGLL